MLCCKNNSDDNNQTVKNEEVNPHQHQSHSHHFWMILVCLIPMGILIFSPLLKTNSTQSSPIAFLLILICPLMHILMMFGMRKKRD